MKKIWTFTWRLGYITEYLKQFIACYFTKSVFVLSFIQASHEDIHVEVFVKDNLRLTAEGKEDYYQKFGFILQSFIERKVNGFHT